MVAGGLSSLISGAFFAANPNETLITDLEQQQIQEETQDAAELSSLIQVLGNIGIALGAIVIGIGVGYLIVSYGLFKGRLWAWTIAVFLTVVSIVIQVAFVVSTSMLNSSLNHVMNTSIPYS